MTPTKKTVLITGGAKRIGKALAFAFAKKGYRVAYTYFSSQKEAFALHKELTNQGIETLFFRCELGNWKNSQKIYETCLKKWKNIDVLINCASDFFSTPFSKLLVKDWDYFLKTNLSGPFQLSLLFGTKMKKNKSGKIINLIDWAAIKPMKNFLPYSVSKAGLAALTKSLAIELAPEVCVNAISPGPVLPQASLSARELKKLKQSVLLKRIGKPQDVVRAALYLAESADFTTGSVLDVDGGRLLV